MFSTPLRECPLNTFCLLVKNFAAITGVHGGHTILVKRESTLTRRKVRHEVDIQNPIGRNMIPF